MKKEEYDRLREEVIQRHNLAVQAAKDLRIKQMLALDRVWQLAHPSTPMPDSENFKKRAPHRSVDTIVRLALRHHEKAFTVKDIMKTIKTIHPEPVNQKSVATCIERLRRIKVVEKIRIKTAGCRRPENVYKVTTPSYQCSALLNPVSSH
jgi:hypothetical protein